MCAGKCRVQRICMKLPWRLPAGLPRPCHHCTLFTSELTGAVGSLSLHICLDRGPTMPAHESQLKHRPTWQQQTAGAAARAGGAGSFSSKSPSAGSSPPCNGRHCDGFIGEHHVAVSSPSGGAIMRTIPTSCMLVNPQAPETTCRTLLPGPMPQAHSLTRSSARSCPRRGQW